MRKKIQVKNYCIFAKDVKLKNKGSPRRTALRIEYPVRLPCQSACAEA